MSLLACTLLAASPKPALYEGLSYSTAVTDRNGALLRLTLSQDDKYRLFSPLRTISPALIEATLLYEDRYFYRHPGINPFSLFRAFWQTYVTGERTVGASTITMQLVRLRFGLATRSLGGKFRQILKALQLEWHYEKDELLEAYLNLAPYGANIEGAGAASTIYFQKDVHDLTLAEALLLCVIPQNPSRHLAGTRGDVASSACLRTVRTSLWERWVSAHPEDAHRRTEVFLDRVLRFSRDLPFRAPHLADRLLAAHPPAGELRTTLELGVQKTVEGRIRAYVERKKSLGITNAAAMLIDARSLEVLALVGSADFANPEIQGQVNGTRAKRSPGSALKPFIYALAFDQGVVHPMTMLKDTPTTFGDWRPENCDREFAGPIHAKDALVRSRNVPAIEIAGQLRNPTLYEFLCRAGISKLRAPEFYGLALVLGGAELTMEELAGLYAALANGGVHKPLRFTLADPTGKGIRILSPEACALVLDILAETPRPDQGYERKWTSSNLEASWKTGTSYSYRDAWCAGVLGTYVLVVWVGNFDGASNPAFVGREAAAPLFFEIAEAVKTGKGDFPPRIWQATKIRPVEVCVVSGQIPGPFCPHKTTTLFIPGISPITTCDIHRLVTVDATSGLRVRPSSPAAGTRTEVFEFWPSDLLELFRRAGIPRRLPPPWDSAASPEWQACQGKPPAITSPKAGITYTVRAGLIGKETIPLSATTDADTQEVFWFVNNTYLGNAPGSRPFFWSPEEPGEFRVKAVDSNGRTHSRKVRVSIVE